MLWIAISIIFGILVIDLLIHIIFAFIVLPIFEHKPPFNVDDDEPSPLAQTITIPTTDNLDLKASLFRSESEELNKLVIFCPEFEGTRWSASRYCHGLVQAGYHVLSFDFRNQGDSDYLKGYDPLHWMTNYELEDVLSVVQYVKQDPELSEMELGIFGVSRGGGAAMVAASRHPEIKRVAAEGLFSAASLSLHFTLRWASLYVPGWILTYTPVWHLKTTLYIARRLCGLRKHFKLIELEKYLVKLKQKSIYLIMGEKDSYVEPQISKSLMQYTDSCKTRIWEVKDARHNMSRQMAPEEYDQNLVDFFMGNNDAVFSEKESGNTSLSAENPVPDHKI